MDDIQALQQQLEEARDEAELNLLQLQQVQVDSTAIGIWFISTTSFATSHFEMLKHTLHKVLRRLIHIYLT